ncbi:M13 family peptidase, partial [Klebsiella pneumoniae]|nr:M13 family peptidase [Klebsiella pneumoniae]
SVRLNEEGAAPLKAALKELESVVDAKTFAEASARMELAGEGSSWGAYVTADMMDCNTNVLYLGQSGLAMGNRDYYLKPENEALRNGY